MRKRIKCIINAEKRRILNKVEMHCAMQILLRFARAFDLRVLALQFSTCKTLTKCKPACFVE